jgi:uncharacterized iron-regulated membrane protein
MRTLHRYLAVFAVVFALYVGSTGTLIQLLDLRALLGHAPATDPTMRAIREGHDGPQNFQVLVESDFAAASLPADFDYPAALETVLRSDRSAAAGAPISFLELRVVEGRPVGQISSRGRLLRFDAVSGAMLVGPDTAPPVSLPPGGNQPSLRNTVKAIHRMTAFGDWATLVFAVIALSLCAMVITGLVLYFRLLSARARTGRPGLFWSAGGGWRSLHRAVAIVAGAFLLIVTLSGTFEALGSLGVSFYRVTHHGRPGLTADVSSPLSDAELASMLRTTLRAYTAVRPATPIKVLRLRYFAGMPQGVIVSGGGDTAQYAFNAATAQRASLSGPGYPVTGQPFGWQADQIAKQIHRGDFFGLSGRWMSLFTGFSLLFLSISGFTMYFDLWSRRRHIGRHSLFWS